VEGVLGGGVLCGGAIIPGQAQTSASREKVALRSPPCRTRIAFRTHTHARLVPVAVYPKSEWLSVDSESKVASIAVVRIIRSQLRKK